MDDIHVSERIREQRELLNYTREGFAEKIDISSKFLYEIETGKKGFSVEILSRIAKELKVSSDYLLFGNRHEYGENESILCIIDNNGKQVYRMQKIDNL